MYRSRKQVLEAPADSALHPTVRAASCLGSAARG